MPVEQQLLEAGIPLVLFTVARQCGNASAFVETGTFLGASVAKAIAYFEEIWSCELNSKLAEECQQGFSKFPHVHVANEDSRTFLPRVLMDLERRSKRALLWLDAHFSGDVGRDRTAGNADCPLLEELTVAAAVKAYPPVIAIDDLADMDGQNMPTAYEITSHFRAKMQSEYVFRVCPELRRGVLLCLPEK